MTDQNINITLDQGSTSESHGWQVLGTLLGCGALGMGAWALSNAGLLDLAATGLTMFGFQLVRMMFAAGIIALPQGNGEKSFRETSGFLKVASREFAEWQAGEVADLAFGCAGIGLHGGLPARTMGDLGGSGDLP